MWQMPSGLAAGAAWACWASANACHSCEDAVTIESGAAGGTRLGSACPPESTTVSEHMREARERPAC